MKPRSSLVDGADKRALSLSNGVRQQNTNSGFSSSRGPSRTNTQSKTVTPLPIESTEYLCSPVFVFEQGHLHTPRSHRTPCGCETQDLRPTNNLWANSCWIVQVFYSPPAHVWLTMKSIYICQWIKRVMLFFRSQIIAADVAKSVRRSSCVRASFSSVEINRGCNKTFRFYTAKLWNLYSIWKRSAYTPLTKGTRPKEKLWLSALELCVEREVAICFVALSLTVGDTP